MSVTNVTKYDCPGVMDYNEIYKPWLTNIKDDTSQHNTTAHNLLESTVSPEVLTFECSMTSTLQTWTMIATCCTVVLSFFGNSLILISLRKFRKQFKGSLHLFVGNLAVSDIVIATGMSLHLFEMLCPWLNLSGNIWYCFVKMSISITSYTESGITLMCMSLDRFCAIAYPMRHFLRHRQRRRISSVIVCTWVVSLVTGFLPSLIVYRKNLKLQEVHTCQIPKPSTLGVVAFLLFQIMFNSVLCGLVIRKVKAKRNVAPINKQVIMKSKTRLLVKVYSLFALCWFPFIVVSIVLELDLDPGKRRTFVCARKYLLQLGMVNSCLNWMLYGLTNVRFRKAFKTILSCKNKTESRNSVELTCSA